MEGGFISFYLVLCLLIHNVDITSSKSCSKQSDCSCKTDGGTVIDLSNLANNDGTPSFADTPDPISGSDFYSYNPCVKFTEGSCTDVAMCLIVSTGPISQYVGIGTQDSSTFQYNEEGELTVQYHGDNGDLSIVAITCEEDTTGTFIPKTNENTTFTFELKTKYACIQERISIGTILCISVACVVVVYFGLGVVIQVFVRKQSGIQAIPNSSFWTAVPILIKDGVVFVFRRGKVSSYSKI